MNILSKLNTVTNTTELSYKQKKSFEERKNEATIILNKYPERLPIICEKVPGSSLVPSLDKIKFLVPKNLTVGQFIHVVRKRVEISPTTAIFVYCNNTIPPTSSPLITLYKECHDEDGFLYIQYNGEDTFG